MLLQKQIVMLNIVMHLTMKNSRIEEDSKN